MNRTRIQVAVGLSLLTHAMLAIIPISQPRGIDIGPVHDVPLTVHLLDPKTPLPDVPPQPQPVVKTEPLKTHVPMPRRVAVVREPQPQPIPAPVETPAPAVAPQPQFDMLAMINARREQRREAEHALLERVRERDAGQSTPQSDSELDAINRNLQSLNAGGEGVGGVFTILHKGTRTAEFSFNGWEPDRNRSWREVIEVDAGVGGDIDLAIIKRMIQLIRTHYSGDFFWLSHRLGRQIVLSARLEDNAALEDFLMREFFGTPTLGHNNRLSNK
ncbi:MAG: hypothetical protein ACM3X5_09370 [Bacillota bacterium]